MTPKARHLGIDYGAHNVGTAVSDDEGTMAFPRAILPNDADLVSHILKIIQEERIVRIVVGDTRTLSGEANSITPEAERFVETLRAQASVPVESAREGWSTREAGRFAPKGEEHNDSAAAAVILQRYLEMRQ